MNVLFVGAHPDDIECWAGGTAARYAAEGHDLYFCVATNGNVGSSTHNREQIAAIRHEEARKAAAVVAAELIWLDFTTTGCPYCDYAAQAEADFLAHMASYGYPSIWISVIGTTQGEAQSWATGFGLDPNTVLYDTGGWWGQGVVSGTPTVYLIHTSNMLIWDRADGWVPTTGTEYTEFKNWWADGSSGLIDMLQTAPGAVTP